ncbi:MAG: GDYXXLXY domain-containing protein [Magnetococcales bacterium]|nr:GDYXXLXY domain-containing protein [Magnetococcales bacterium]
MNHSFQKARIVIALLLPILTLGGLILHKLQVLDQGRQVRFPIEGFDPRDLLSGHYLVYRIDYGVLVCPEEDTAVMPDGPRDQEVPAVLCLEPSPSFHYGRLVAQDCRLKIVGSCRGRDFHAGIERFYIPEEHARSLDQAVRERKGELILRVNDAGVAVVEDLLIGGRPWRLAVASEAAGR